MLNAEGEVFVGVDFLELARGNTRRILAVGSQHDGACAVVCVVRPDQRLLPMRPPSQSGHPHLATSSQPLRLHEAHCTLSRPVEEHPAV